MKSTTWRAALAVTATLTMAAAAPVLAAGDSAIADAVQHQDKPAILALLKQKVDVNRPQGDGATALAWAAHFNDLETADLLIRAHANLNAANDLAVTPLMLAATNGSAAMVEKLLTAGADANLARPSGETAPILAARGGNAAVVKLLVSHGANPNAKTRTGVTPLMFAGQEGHAEVTKVLVEVGADVHARAVAIEKVNPRYAEQRSQRRSEGTRGDGQPKLLFKGQAIVVAQLPKEGDGEPPRSEGGFTPLLHAVLGGNVECVKALLAGGAKLDEPAADGSTPLTLAVLKFQEPVALHLIEQGANVNVGDVGYTPLHLAALTGQMAVAKALIAKMADVNAALQYPGRLQAALVPYNPDLQSGRLTQVGATPFMLAAKAVNVGMMKLLLDSGADWRRTSESKTTAMQLAAGLGKRQVTDMFTFIRYYTWDEDRSIAAIKFLIDLGADVNEANEFGETPLHGATYHAADKVIQFLVDRGADVNATNWSDQTPLRLANGHFYSGTFVRYPETAALYYKLGADPKAGTQLKFSMTGYVDDNLKDEEKGVEPERPRP